MLKQTCEFVPLSEVLLAIMNNLKDDLPEETPDVADLFGSCCDVSYGDAAHTLIDVDALEGILDIIDEIPDAAVRPVLKRLRGMQVEYIDLEN